ncbi:hypothetical protein ACTJI5_22155 [Sphingopyxis sp. 22461]
MRFKVDALRFQTSVTESRADPETRLDASSDIRSLVGKIVLHPGAKRGEGSYRPPRLAHGHSRFRERRI